MENVGKSTVGYTISFAIASIVNGLLVIIKEEYAPLKDFMKSLSGHHWITHGIFIIVIFLLLGYVFSRGDVKEKYDPGKLSAYIVFSTIIGSLLIFGYFLTHI